MKELGVYKIKDYSNFSLYQVCKKKGSAYVPIYKTTLKKFELRKYEALND